MKDITASINNVVITGVSSGLGKYLKGYFDGSTSISHANYIEELRQIDHPIDLIIHCASDASHEIINYQGYIKNNLFYTLELCENNPKHIIYISSAAIHFKENSNYKLTKLLAENIIKDNCDSYTIIRPSAILGPEMRPNSLVKIIDNYNTKLTLSEMSTFNYVLQKDIAEFIKLCYNNKIIGTYEFVSNDMISLGSIARKFGKNPTFGEWKHKASFVNNQKTVDIFETINKSSWDVIDQFLKDRKDKNEKK